MNLHQNKPPTWLVHIPGHPWVLGQAMGILDHETHHDPDSGEATTFPHIVFSAPPRWGYIQMALFPGTPKLESRNCPETVLGGVPRLWEVITPDCQVWSRRGLNQTCSPCWDLFNYVSRSQFGGREEVNSNGSSGYFHLNLLKQWKLKLIIMMSNWNCHMGDFLESLLWSSMGHFQRQFQK